MTLYDIGDQIEGGPLTIYVTTDAGIAATATVTCTITLPDGTTTSPSVTTSATGTYETAYAPAMAGTFYVKWSATSIGGVSGENDVFEDSFTVSESTNTFISLAEAKSFGNFQDTADDDELLAYLEWACDLAEEIADTNFARRTYTAEKHTIRGARESIQLRHKPILSITTVVERGTTLTANTGYTHDATYGTLYRMSGTYDATTWLEGTNAVSVTYVAGYAIIPTPVRNATLQILDHLWQNQRNPAGRPSRGQDYPQAGANWNVPNKARDILMDYRPPLVG